MRSVDMGESLRGLGLRAVGHVACLAIATVGAAVGGCAVEETPVTEVVVDAAAEHPPAVSGGSMTLTRDGKLAVIADNSQDAIYLVDATDLALVGEVKLEPGDEPGRIVEGADHQMYVALRRGGAVVHIDADSREIVQRVSVCGAPRGMVFDAAAEVLHVACAAGELVAFSENLGTEVSRRRFDADLRDLVIRDGRLLASQFRAATLTDVTEGDTVGDEGALTAFPNEFTSQMLGRRFQAAVAYRTKVTPSGDVMMLHQRHLVDEIPTGAPNGGGNYYGGNCDEAIVHAAITTFDGSLGVRTPVNFGTVGTLVLPTDLDISPDGLRVAVAAAGSDEVAIMDYREAVLGDAFANFDCFGGTSPHIPVLGEPVSVAFIDNDRLLVQTRQPAAVVMVSARARQVVQQTNLPVSGGRNWGHALFHKAAAPTSPIACASCHPEGREDGHVWSFQNIGLRRTQTVSGDVLETMPLHWDGDMTTMHDLMGEVFVNRMGGVAQPADRVDALGEWMSTLAPLPAAAARDTSAIERGETLFHDGTVGCATCHTGQSLTSNETIDVGTGKAFQVPTLLAIAHRAPFMHDGCAATLHDRFSDTACGGGDKHGQTSHLSAEQIDDLVAYLETL